MIELILSFTASIAIGYLLSRMSAFPVLRRLTDISTTIAIYLLLFFLGAQTGSNEDVLSNIASLGLDALLLALAGTVGSAFSAWLLYRYHRDFSLKAVESCTDNRKRSFGFGAFGSLVALFLGVISGVSGIAAPLLALKLDLAMLLLYILLISVGLGIGLKPGLGAMLKGIKISILLLPLLSIAFTLLFCAFMSLAIRDWGLWDCLAVGSGLGYYSLSSVMIAGLKESSYGIAMATALGTMALLSNIFRELIALIFTPFLAKRLGPYAAVAAAGATSMDVCLPGITRSCGPEIIPATLICGVLTDFSVPFLVSFFCSL